LVQNISDIIEQYLKDILRQSEEGVIELQRSELAELFQCVPSQINYVISTRFSFEQGYIVESKRGGGGYIRIRQLTFGSAHKLLQLLKSLPEEMSQREADGLVERLERDELITTREALLIRNMVKREVLNFELPLRDILRARLIYEAVQVILLTESM
jgi:transcriptional regulator of stress and heat shock response